MLFLVTSKLKNGDGMFFCRPCGKEVDWTRESSVKGHIVCGIHEINVQKWINSGHAFVFAHGNEEDATKRQEKKAVWWLPAY